MANYESDCTRTVTFFKIPVYKIKAFFQNSKSEVTEDESLLKLTQQCSSWSLLITPIRKVNIAHMTNSLVQKLIQVSPEEESHLSQILKFKSLLPPKVTLDSSQALRFECTNQELRISDQEGVCLGNMDGVVICDLLAKVYFDAAYRGLPCPDLLKNLMQQDK